MPLNIVVQNQNHIRNKQWLVLILPEFTDFISFFNDINCSRFEGRKYIITNYLIESEILASCLISLFDTLLVVTPWTYFLLLFNYE